MAQGAAEHALADLVRTRGKDLTSYAFLLTGDLAAAQDLVQDALMKVFVRTRSGFTPDVAEAYVRRAILTLYVDGYRRRRHWASVLHLVATRDEHQGPELATADRVDLHAALATLSTQERASVVLRFFEDLTVPEIADQMGLAQGTVKRYLSNAVHKLEARLGPMPQLDADDGVAEVRPAPHPRRTAAGRSARTPTTTPAPTTPATNHTPTTPTTTQARS